ncbi:P-loop containing nucleoside triphosphate hydrolase protein [Trichoderma compactum]
MPSHHAPYIPVGCIEISQHETNVSKDDWFSAENWAWKSFLQPRDDWNFSEHVNPSLQESLFDSSKLSPLSKLFHARWCKLDFRVTARDGNPGIIRVFLLPDDIERGSISRSNPDLRKARLLILQSLDYSPSAWRAFKAPDQSGGPIFDDPKSIDNDKSVSLLELFNNIPSPCPDFTVSVDKYTGYAIWHLIDSKVQGLKTELYSHQRRSAAVMLQKEAQPGQILDPRLLHLRDPDGSHWYMDPVTGEVLSEPRYYDGVSGGILAEQMGTGKTLICLALIVATKDLPTSPPDCYREDELPVRRRIASLVDMAASCANRHAAPGRPYFAEVEDQLGYKLSRCQAALSRNPGYYVIPVSEDPLNNSCDVQSEKIYLSSATVIIVPNNLVAQWRQEITKHTEGLKVLVLAKTDEIPSREDISTHDIILFSRARFETVHKEIRYKEQCERKRQHQLKRERKPKGDKPELSPFLSIHFKRCIVDEGHHLGNSTSSNKSNLLIGLESMHFSSHWVVTGTPSRGLYGDENGRIAATLSDTLGDHQSSPPNTTTNQANEIWDDEKKDLDRIGSIAKITLKARPWANKKEESGDTPADWNTYVMLPRHSRKSRGRWRCLESTLNSLIVRHRISEISTLLPAVNEKIVELDGSYQDQLSQNLFSMMFLFNSVQSQREGVDYFFHPTQRKELLQLVRNMRQASFFGGSFFPADKIANDVEDAEKFLVEEKIPISPEDELSFQEAIEFGNLAKTNKLRNLINQSHEMVVSVTGFPGNAGASWSLDGASAGNSICTSTSMLLSLQKLIYNSAESEEKLNSLLNGGLTSAGRLERTKLINAAALEEDFNSKKKISETLVGNTKLGNDRPKKARSHGVNGIEPRTLVVESFAGHLEQTKVTATVSAKLSYLIDSIVKYQEEEKIIVFYENENVAWYLASMLDVLQIQNLIYAKSVPYERRAQYAKTFNHNEKFRVLLMDISQAAFGLDMREASRIYFINPVLNPQVEAQAIGRARRISQKKPVWVETLVLKNSLDEVILKRKGQMTQAEHSRVKSILDVRAIFDWIKNTKVTPMEPSNDTPASQMAALHSPQVVFGRGFGVTVHPDDGIVLDEALRMHQKKRPYEAILGSDETMTDESTATSQQEVMSQSARRVRFT